LEGKDPTGLTVLANFQVVVEEYKSPQLATKVGLAANSSFEVGDFQKNAVWPGMGTFG